MKELYMVMFFILGTFMGSFYNVLGLRIPNNESIVKPGSHCTRCGHRLKWYELIPIFSYLFLGGKCRNCKEKISWLYPFSEFMCGLLFMISYYSWGLSLELIISLTLCSLLVVVTVCDLTYMIIPDRFSIISSIIIIIVKLIDSGVKSTVISIGYGILSFALMFLIMKLGSVAFKKECLGGADVKLMFVVGLILNPLLCVFVIVIASTIALFPSIYLYIKSKENVIPFGPFIIIGLLITYFSKIKMDDIINFLTNL